MPFTNLAKPKNVDELCHFLRLTGYWRLVHLFADIMKLPNKLLRKDTKFQWLTQCQTAFDHLKNSPCKRPILPYPYINQRNIQFTYKSKCLF